MYRSVILTLLPCILLSNSFDPFSHSLVGTTPELIMQQKDIVIRVQNSGKKASGGDQVISSLSSPTEQFTKHVEFCYKNKTWHLSQWVGLEEDRVLPDVENYRMAVKGKGWGSGVAG